MVMKTGPQPTTATSAAAGSINIVAHPKLPSSAITSTILNNNLHKIRQPAGSESHSGQLFIYEFFTLDNHTPTSSGMKHIHRRTRTRPK